MKTVCYHNDGKAIPDAKAEELAREFLSSLEKSISVSTENFILAIRCLVKEDVYPHDKVLIQFKEEKFIINKYGRLTEWPLGFCDYSEDFLSRLLDPKKKL